MSEMIERVAQAIRLEWAAHSTTPLPFYAGELEAVARAAIAAMREPTDDMKQIEGVHWGYPCAICGGLTEGWYAMIDEALK
jgi:hypothetical protein